MSCIKGSKHSKVTKKKIAKGNLKRWTNKNYKTTQMKRLRMQASNLNKANKKMWKEPKFHAKMCKARKKQAKTHAKTYSNAMKLKWKDVTYRKKILKARAKSKKYQNRGKTISKVMRRNNKKGVGQKVWNKGLTKFTDKRLKAISKRKIGTITSPGRRRWLYKNCDKKIVMRSSWEVAFAYWLDQGRTKWQYEPRWFNIGSSIKYKGVSYTPDFWIPSWNSWVEIKGLDTKEFRAKLKRFHKCFPNENIIVILGNELKQLQVLDVHGSAKHWKKRGKIVKKLRTLSR